MIEEERESVANTHRKKLSNGVDEDNDEPKLMNYDNLANDVDNYRENKFNIE